MLVEIDRLQAFLQLLRQERLSAAALKALQEEKLRAVVRHAYDHVPYYRSLFHSAGLLPEDIRTLDDLPRIPMTRKEDLRAAGLSRTIAEGTDPAHCVVLHTSGTTGRPFEVYMSPGEASLRRLVQLRALLSAGFRPWDRLVILGATGSGPARLRHRLGVYSVRVIQMHTPVAQQLLDLQKARPTILWAYPSVLHAVAQRAQYMLSAYIHPRLLITSASKFQSPVRERIEGDLGCHAFDFYGTMEVGRMAAECPARQGLHVQADQIILECLEDGKPATPGTWGAVVVTSLNGYVMPFIRYQLADRCQLSPGPCACGRSFPMISAFRGRKQALIQLPSGALVSPGLLKMTIRRLPWVEQYLIIQESVDQFRLLLVLSQQVGKAALTELESRLEQQLGEPVCVRIEVVDSIAGTGYEAVTFASKLPVADVGAGEETGRP